MSVLKGVLSLDAYFSISPCCCQYHRCAKWVSLPIRSRRAIQASIIVVAGLSSVSQYLGISSRAATILGTRTALSARCLGQRRAHGQGCPRSFGSGGAALGNIGAAFFPLPSICVGVTS